MFRLIVVAFFLVTSTMAMNHSYHLGIAEKINRRYQELWNARNFEALVNEIYTPDAVFVGIYHTYTGRDKILAAYQTHGNGTKAKITKFNLSLLYIDTGARAFLVGAATTLQPSHSGSYYAIQTIRNRTIARFELAKQ